MIGSIIGDVVGSRFEFENCRSKDFNLFDNDCFFTDDTVCTMAVTKTLLEYVDEAHFYAHYDLLEEYKNKLIVNLKDFTRRYPDRAYGRMFEKWSLSKSNMPYNSFGNGSAARISPIVWFSISLDEVKFLTKATSEVTHNHPLGIKGAEAIATAAFMAKAKESKTAIKNYIYENYYPIIKYLDYDELVKNNEFDDTCEGSVPLAIYCFLISKSFEDSIRLAISIGGDSDTIAAMTGTISEAFYNNKDTNKIIRSFFKMSYLPKEYILIYKDFLEFGKRQPHKMYKK